MADGMRAKGCAETLASVGNHVIARVQSHSKAFDVAFMSRTGGAGVARCTDEPTLSDIEALSTMLEEGPFIVALLVSPQPFATPSSPVLCCSLDELPGVLEAACA